MSDTFRGGPTAAFHISDPDVRALFIDEQELERENMRFLYSTTPESTKYYVFQWRRGPGDWVDAKMTKLQLVAQFGRLA